MRRGGCSVILNLKLMILAGMVTVGGALGDRPGRMRMFRLGILRINRLGAPRL